MAKNITNKTTVFAEKMPEERRSANPVFLNMGQWRHSFTSHQRKIIIAQALNSAVHDKKLTITGYLITRQQVCLVVLSVKKHIHKLLQVFYEYVRIEINNYSDVFETLSPQLYDQDDEVISMLQAPALFEEYSENSDYLVRLITGRHVTLPYYDPNLSRLKKMVNAAAFCSAIDYAGAVGPVVVKLWYNDDLKEAQ